MILTDLIVGNRNPTRAYRLVESELGRTLGRGPNAGREALQRLETQIFCCAGIGRSLIVAFAGSQPDGRAYACCAESWSGLARRGLHARQIND